ncbi:restriction endonuclease subunit S [Aerolutibacter ruishenii]|uniref:Type I restriction enzyme S subunit n=1 Tax=Aerolutibacter ruishenii TaxID=686800 RepID=A0A562M172_9GAMM|nr:restriction endonuclease subunit S [Lysobacter ruishenii]TWI13538.1 type I restriction enzyme S subunit [Lysobacter ruishenii]
MSWTMLPFEDLYELPSRNGITRPSKVRGAGFRMINMGELFANDRIGDIEMELVQLNEKELDTMLVNPGDLLFARQSLVLSGAGKCSIVVDAKEPTTFESHLIRVRLKAGVTDPRFYHYYFKSPASPMRSIVTQGVQAGIRANDLKRLMVPCPPLSEQECIADILSTYDDLIENNRRRIALLEQSVRLLYREWFAHLRFPGHEHVKVVDGVPEGWAIFAVSEVADLYRGISYSSDQLVEDGGKPFVNLKCINRFGGFRVSGVKRFLGEHKSQHVVKAGDIVVAVTDMTRDAMIVAQAAIVPKIVGDDAVFSMDMVKLVPKPAFASHWFHALLRFSSFSLEVREKATGATVLHLRPKHIEEWRTPVPPPALRDEYAEYVSPMYALMDELELQNEKLRQARDLLLPRLMSGELAV